MRPRRVLGYARVSTRDQVAGTSLDTQRAAIDRFCAERAYPSPIVRVEVESGSGERSEARIEQRRLVEEVRVGDLVLVATQDRWSRDTIHFLSSADEIRRRGGRLLSISEGSNVDSPEDRLNATQRAAFAEYERRRIIQRSAIGMRALHERGLFVYGRAFLGYRLEARRLVVVEDQAAIVREMFAWCIAGVGTHEISDRLRARGVVGDHALVARRLRDKRYLGLVRRDPTKPRSDWITGQHSAILDEDTFDRASASLRDRAHGGRRASPEGLGARFLVAGVLRCAHCGHVMSCTRAGEDGTITHDGWYACHYARRGCVAPRARRDVLDPMVERLVLEKIESLREELSRTPRVEAKPEVDELEPIARARMNVIDAIAAGVVSHEAARAKLTSLEHAELGARARIEERRQKLGRESVEGRAARLADVTTIRRAWARMAVPKRREALLAIVEKVAIRSTRRRRWERGAWEIEVAWR